MLKQSQLISLLSPLFLSVMILLLSACAHSPQQEIALQAPIEQRIDTPENSSPSPNAPLKSMDWVYNADARADAHVAIAKQNFQFLATSNRTVSLPGIDLQQNSLEELQEQCGYRFLAGMGDTLRTKSDIEVRKALHRYATEYNKLMFIACQGGTL